jgi:hypothetical protein
MALAESKIIVENKIQKPAKIPAVCPPRATVIIIMTRGDPQIV